MFVNIELKHIFLFFFLSRIVEVEVLNGNLWLVVIPLKRYPIYQHELVSNFDQLKELKESFPLCCIRDILDTLSSCGGDLYEASIKLYESMY